MTSKLNQLTTNLSTGTPITDKTDNKPHLTANEIIAIIKVCAKANVAVFSYSDMRIEFNASTNEIVDKHNSSAFEPSQPTDAEISVKHDQINKESLEIDEARTKEERLALMLIENPLEAERLISSGELTETDDEEQILDD